MDAKNAGVAFCDLIKTKILFNKIYKQALQESNISEDAKLGRKFLKLVKARNTAIGARLGIRFSVRTIGKWFGKSKATGARYLNSLEKSGRIKVQKEFRVVCEPKDAQAAIKALDLYGRTFIKVIAGKPMLCERLQNAIIFL